jgi:hypothetical protein
MAEVQAFNLKAFIEAVDRAFSANALVSGSKEEIERARYVVALTAVAKFFDTFKDTSFIANHFAELASAIQDLDAGVTRPLLSAAKKSGNPVEASNLWRARASVAIAIEARRRQGKNRKVAAKSIAKECPEIQSLIRRQTDKDLWESILFWHNQFVGNRRVKNFEGAAVFKEGIKVLDKCEKDNGNLDRFVAWALTEVRKYTE